MFHVQQQVPGLRQLPLLTQRIQYRIVSHIIRHTIKLPHTTQQLQSVLKLVLGAIPTYQNIESSRIGANPQPNHILENCLTHRNRVRRRESYQRIEKSVAGEQIGGEMVPLHHVEDLGGEVWLSGLNIGTHRGIKKGFGGSWEAAVGVEEGLVQMVLPIGGDERDKEGLGIGELVVAEEGGEEGEEWGRGLGEGGNMGP
ncbi:hypothetical protein PanWU01x14_283380 [Parasponia andersonii]|uniref:Uncharacterized protein n=1 Tax=Parasponia andersonii TaxID=3476 RepID=A0A2P5B099_PARAD|nr:hypothetical protein PanWU01x14_283380 [Parasponia andersonii]